jgi:hypothetical protein
MKSISENYNKVKHNERRYAIKAKAWKTLELFSGTFMRCTAN